MNINFEALTGREIYRLVQYKDNVWVHESVLDDLLELQKICLNQGYELEIASGFRSFERQKLIWEEKISGERPLYDKSENLVDIEKASETEILEALLAWSAIPGCSRHHWGTDFDLFDKNNFKDGLKLQLKQDEYLNPEGPCFEMNQFLESHNDLKFFRPYETEGDGVQPEPWHYSHRYISNFYQQAFTKEIFRKNLETREFTFSEALLHDIDILYARFSL